MKSFIGSVVIGLSAFLGGCTPVAVERPSQINPLLAGCKLPPEHRSNPHLKNSFFKRVADIDELMSPTKDARTGVALRSDYKGAWPLIQSLINTCSECSRYEMAQLYQRAAVVRYNLDDIEGTIHYFQKVLGQTPDIPITLEEQVTYHTAQLLMSVEKYGQALSYFDKWEALCPLVVPDDYFYFRAQNLYLMERRDEALLAIQLAARLARAKSQTPKEAWGKLELAILIKREDFESALPVAERLAVEHPTSHNLKTLAHLYRVNKRESDEKVTLDRLKQINSQDTSGDEPKRSSTSAQ